MARKEPVKIVIEGGTVNASSSNGAGIGSGIGYARSKPAMAITADIEIHGGMITAYSEQEPASEVVMTVHRRC